MLHRWTATPKLWLATFLVTVLVISLQTLSGIGHAATTPNCPDVAVIGARGSGEDPKPPQSAYAKDDNGNYPPNHAIGGNLASTFDDFAAAVAKKGLTTEIIPVDYIAYGLDRLFNPSPFNQDLTAGYAESIKLGITDAATRVNEVLARGCAVTPQIVMLGYSQGALVVTGALEQLSPSERRSVTAVLLYGDPNYDPTKQSAKGGAGKLGGPGVLPALKTLAKLSGPFTNLSANLLPIARLDTGLPSDIRKRTYDYCFPGDPACQPLASGAGNLNACFHAFMA